MKRVVHPFSRRFFEQYPLATSMFPLFQQLPNVSFYVKDAQSRFVYINQGILDLYDLQDVNDVIGKSDRNFHPPALAEAYIAEDKRVVSTGKPVNGELWLVPHIRGTPQWFVSSKTPLFDQKGQVIGLAGAMFRVERPLEQERYFGRLKSALDFLEKNFARSLSMSEAAARCGLPITSFNRQFRQLLRMTPSEYLLSWRIEAARRRLVETDKALSEIAMDCGFSDQSHFTKRFQRMTGITPLAYRKQFKAAK